MNIFQSSQWENFKLKTGYQKSYRVDDILVLQKNLPLGYSMLYSPMVSQPESDGIMNGESRIKEYLDQIKKIGQENKSIFYRLEFDVPLTNSPAYQFTGFSRSFEEMQPEHTWVLNLSDCEENILKNMKQRARYSIRMASKYNVEINSGASKEYVDLFYTLYSQTAARHKITYRSKKYFDELFDSLVQNNLIKFYAAYLDGAALACSIVVFSGKTAINMFGASSTEHREANAPNLLQWEIIRDCKKEGYKKYDFFGIAPTDDSKHKWAGITLFKKSFGGEQRDILGSYDLVLMPIEYNLFKIVEKIRRPK